MKLSTKYVHSILTSHKKDKIEYFFTPHECRDEYAARKNSSTHGVRIKFLYQCVFILDSHPSSPSLRVGSSHRAAKTKHLIRKTSYAVLQQGFNNIQYCKYKITKPNDHSNRAEVCFNSHRIQYCGLCSIIYATMLLTGLTK